MGLPRNKVIRRTSEFQHARTFGSRQECGFFLWNLVRQPESASGERKLGVIATRRFGNAVERNRARRRLKSLFREHQQLLPEGCHLVLVARRRMKRAAWSELVETFLKMASREKEGRVQ
ncbi:MAG: ribonuclease P protein component [Opitutales bacterium]|nr:ribonuclease P protein component [Opitutales bacterium]